MLTMPPRKPRTRRRQKMAESRWNRREGEAPVEPAVAAREAFGSAGASPSRGIHIVADTASAVRHIITGERIPRIPGTVTARYCTRYIKRNASSEQEIQSRRVCRAMNRYEEAKTNPLSS